MEASLQYLNRLTGRHGSHSEETLPVYTSVPGTAAPSRSSSSTSSSISSVETEICLDDEKHHCSGETDAPPSPQQRPRARVVLLPTMKRFLADFTLGFADGLTVPFALTAGLSSLGETSTVIYAGMAEICAGSISMGIGGYLAARGSGESQAPDTLCGSSSSSSHGDDDVEKHPLYPAPQDYETAAETARAAVVEHLALLRLPRHLVEAAWAHVREDLQSHGGAEDGAAVLVAALSRRSQTANPREDEAAALESGSYSSVHAGLSVSAGYLTGGSLPLFPYFFVASVDDGLLWSFLVCVAALFVFGFAKHCLLSEASAGNGGSGAGGRPALAVDWRRLRGGVWEGLKMVVLGSLAALAAVLCVRLFSGLL